MVNGVILVVDAFEGVMPQTKFVLMKALDLKLPVIVCVNKVDRPEARPNEVVDEVLELFMDLDASDEQLDCPFLFASARDGYAVREIHDLVNNKKDMTPLFETILDYIPAPEGDPEAPTQVLISTIDYNEYVGRIGVGKVDNGTISVNQDVVVVNHHDPDKQQRVKIGKLYEFDGLNRVEVKEATIGSIVAVSGIADISIGDTLCSPENPEAIPFQKISEPTISMQFIVNDSPFGRDAAPGERRHGRTRPRNHRYGNPRRAAGPDQPVAGVGHQRQPGVGNKRKRPASIQQAQHFVQLALFVMVMKTHEPLGFHPTALAQQPRAAGIFRKDHIRAFQHFPRTGRKITRVAKRRRHYP